MKLLLFISDRPFSKEAISFTELLAKLTQASVTLHYVARRDKGLAAGKTAIAQARERLPDMPIEEYLQVGRPLGSLLREIHIGDYDMVIIGARRGLGFFARTFSSLTQKVISCAPVPVLVVRQEVEKLERVLICTGGLVVAEQVVEAGARVAQAAGAHATLLHISEAVPSMYTGLDEMEETLEELLLTDTPLAQHMRRGAEILADHGVEGQLELRRGIVSDTILREAQRGKFDLIVLGASGVKSTLKGWMMGNVTQQVINHCLCPVLVVI
jgi:nucleotide-binding universal stress UspA family protein